MWRTSIIANVCFNLEAAIHHDKFAISKKMLERTRFRLVLGLAWLVG